MPMTKVENLDANTESKIKAAAKRVFHNKGYAATRTRDIAEESGINLALLNYYFRSKKKLFDIIMFETMGGFMQNMGLVFNDEHTTLQRKVELIAENYINMFVEEPQVPLFILSEMRNDVDGLLERIPIRDLLMNSVFIRQIHQEIKEGRMIEVNPLHFLMNLLSLVIFPFAGSPMISKIAHLSDKEREALMIERKRLIPIWINAMFLKV